ncbi:3-hydroxyacyl-CoA dehydrogenase [Rhodococcus opacus]|uniref:3-hydroxyacyl-CoA dehydrogenase n=1 Tax=Rhodococcus opacus TaxID=37919 RepID=UPI002954F3B4|nr:3-hydroxyacyl-CoA dehydrogenase [Rhodococcus opacus]MDV7089956.1 3-hydroxyacyl-CoA dehydrogenase [Rhodococcus opacus]
MSDLNRVTVVGAGVLGGQIAWHSAFHGKDVVVYDLHQEAIENCRAAHEMYAGIYRADVAATDEDIAKTRKRLTYSTTIAEAVQHADLVIEAVSERPEVKTSVYETMAPHLPEHTLIATNSSTLLPQDFAAATGRPDKYCAMHFANLIWKLNAVEIMAHPETAHYTLTAATEFGIEIGMVPVPIRKQQNGYAINTWLVPLLNAAQTLVTNEIATPEDVDRTYMIVNRGCSMGLLGLIDVIGMNTVFDVLDHWGHVHNDEQMLRNADHIKKNFLDQGLLGLQTGRGYYNYPNPAYGTSDFLSPPDISAASDIAAQALLLTHIGQ